MKNVKLITEAIRKSLDPVKIVLFGSYARGETDGDSDLDLAVIQKSLPKLGQKANIYLNLVKLGYDWKIEPDIHLFSEKDFSNKLKNGDLFVREISKGKVVYAG